MRKTNEFKNCLLAHSNGLTIIVEAPAELFGLMDGTFLDDHSLDPPKLENGIYRATVEYWFDRTETEAESAQEYDIDLRLADVVKMKSPVFGSGILWGRVRNMIVAGPSMGMRPSYTPEEVRNLHANWSRRVLEVFDKLYSEADAMDAQELQVNRPAAEAEK